MAQLNEDVLRLIFDYFPTPREWIQVSEVCKLWKSAASKQWRKVSEIDLNGQFCVPQDTNAPVISQTDVNRIAKCAASSVKVLTTCSEAFGNFGYKPTHKIWKFGPFMYKVRKFNAQQTLLLVAQNATNITEIYFKHKPEPELFQLFINMNKIKVVEFETSHPFYDDVPTNEIEELKLSCSRPGIKSFEGHFPRLKKLNLTVDFESMVELQETLSAILPHVLGLTSLSLSLKFNNFSDKDLSKSCKVFVDIAKFSQLENLSLSIFEISATAMNSFVKKLVEGCPKLRSVKFGRTKITGKQLCTLLTLPCLESLKVDAVSDFHSTNQPEMPHLKKLILTLNCRKFDILSFCEVLRKMPNLKALAMKIDPDNDDSDNETFKLVRQVAFVAVSQNKNVDIHPSRSYWNWNFAIVKKNEASYDASLFYDTDTDTEIETLNLTVSIYDDAKFEENLKKFVTKNLKSHKVLGSRIRIPLNCNRRR